MPTTSDFMQIPSKPRQDQILRILMIGFALWAVASRIWVAEDAYITFRTVENLYLGHGLVFNPGVHSEASTHPLWTMLLIIIRGLGLPLHFGSILLGLCFSLSALALLFTGSRTTHQRPASPAASAGGTRDVKSSCNSVRAFPFAALALVSISGLRDFATAGMEYSAVFLLLVLLFRFLERHRLVDRPFLFACLLALLYLSRPELGLLIAYYSGWILVETLHPGNQRFFTRLIGIWREPGALLRLMAWAAGILLIAGSYHLFRAVYYQDFFPNTYYAKSGMSSYYLQGIRYLLLAVWWAPGLWLILIVTIGFPLLQRFRGILPPRAYIPYLRELGAVAILTFYIVRVGGDFMAFRFLLPEIIMLALLADRFFREAPDLPERLFSPLLARVVARIMPRRIVNGKSSCIRYALLVIFIACALRPIPLYEGSISDERQFFVKDSEGGLATLLFGQNHAWGQRGQEFRHFEDCVKIPDFWITNSQAQAACLKGIGLGYFGVAAGPGVKILDEQALPNPDIARLPVLYRWRPGHEHYLDLSNVIRRGVAFCSSGEPVYDRVMLTPMGIVIDFRRELLATLPDIQSRLIALQQLKAAGSPIIPRLESRYSTSVEDLIAEAGHWERDPELQARTECWKKHGSGASAIFY